MAHWEPGLGTEAAAAKRRGLGGWQLPTGGAELPGRAALGRGLAASQAALEDGGCGMGWMWDVEDGEKTQRETKHI